MWQSISDGRWLGACPDTAAAAAVSVATSTMSAFAGGFVCGTLFTYRVHVYVVVAAVAVVANVGGGSHGRSTAQSAKILQTGLAAAATLVSQSVSQSDGERSLKGKESWRELKEVA